MIKLVILKTVKKRIVLHLKAMLVSHPEIKQRGTEKRFHGYGYILKKKETWLLANFAKPLCHQLAPLP